MTGRPVTNPAWASETVFPGMSGSTPWAAQPCKVAPSGDLWTPNTKPPAENLNWLLNKMGSDTKAVLDWSGNGPGLDWRPRQASTAILAGSDNAVFTAVRWDSIGLRWLVGAMSVADGSGNGAIYTMTDGVTDGAVAGALVSSSPHVATAVPFDVMYDGTRYWMASISTGNVLQLNSCASAGAFTLEYSDNTKTFTGCAEAFFDGQAWLAYNTSTLMFLANGAHGAVAINAAGLTGTSLVGCLQAASASVLLLIASGVCGSYLSVSSGGVVSTVAVPWSTDVPMGATYGEDVSGTPCFYVVTAPSGGGMNTWRSYDGAAWTQVGGIVVSFAPAGLTSLGGLLCVSTPVGAITSGQTLSFFSVDGGLTWRKGVNSTLGTSSAFAGLRPVVAASDTQCLEAWQVYLRVSGPAGMPTATA